MSLIVPFVKNVLGELGMGDARADEEEAGGCSGGGSSGHFVLFLFLFSGKWNQETKKKEELSTFLFW